MGIWARVSDQTRKTEILGESTEPEREIVKDGFGPAFQQ